MERGGVCRLLARQSPVNVARLEHSWLAPQMARRHEGDVEALVLVGTQTLDQVDTSVIEQCQKCVKLKIHFEDYFQL